MKRRWLGGAVVVWAAATVVAGACTNKTSAQTNGSGLGSGTAGAAPVCADVLADAVTEPVTVRFVNHTAADLFIGDHAACDDALAFDLFDANGHELNRRFSPPCYASCATLASVCTCTVTNTCFPTHVVRIAPQGVATLNWNGAYVAPRTVPASCTQCGSGQAELDCNAYADPGPVALTFRASAWTANQCITGTCDCTPDAAGTCPLDGEATTSGTAVTAEALLAPGGTSIDLVFQ